MVTIYDAGVEPDFFFTFCTIEVIFDCRFKAATVKGIDKRPFTVFLSGEEQWKQPY